MRLLTDETVVVTGSSSGIGASVARSFAREGAKVVITGRRKERLDELARELTNDGGQIEPVIADITVREDVDRLFERCKQRFGPVSILVNCAGIMLASRFERGQIDDWEYMNKLNVISLFYASYRAIDQMKSNGGGSIIHIGSSAALRQRPLTGAYAGTKAAIRAAADSMRQEVIEHKIRVCTIMPGAVATDLVSHITDPESQAGFAQVLKMERLQAEDIANIVAFVARQPAYVNINEVVVRPLGQQL